MRGQPIGLTGRFRVTPAPYDAATVKGVAIVLSPDDMLGLYREGVEAHIAAIAAAVLTQYGHLGQASVLIGGSCEMVERLTGRPAPASRTSCAAAMPPCSLDGPAEAGVIEGGDGWSLMC